MQVILDISANTHQNDQRTIKKLIAAIPKTDKHNITLKTQLWSAKNPQGRNARTTTKGLHTFMVAAKLAGYDATSSVFDRESVLLLMKYKPKFVKIAFRDGLDMAAGAVCRDVPIYKSCDVEQDGWGSSWSKDRDMFCVPEYPAPVEKYYRMGHRGGVSDHSAGLHVWHMAMKDGFKCYECHYVLERNYINPDAGPFAKTPEDLREMFA